MRHTIYFRGVPIAHADLAPGSAAVQSGGAESLPAADVLLAAPARAARAAWSAERASPGAPAATELPAARARRVQWIGAAVRHAGQVVLPGDFAVTQALAPDLELRDARGGMVPTTYIDLVLAPGDGAPVAVAVHWDAAPAFVPAVAPTPVEHGHGAQDLSAT